MNSPSGSIVENSLLQNAFYVLGATTRDNQSRIVELTDERSLMINSDHCQRARAALTSPRSRLAAELSWLPGVSPHRAQAAVDGLKNEPAAANVVELPPLARANVLAARVESVEIEYGAAVKTLLALAASSEEIDAEAVMRDINEDRSIAGVPPVRDLDQVYVELAGRRRHYRDVARALLDRYPTRTLVQLVTELAAKATDGGQSHAPILAEDIIDAYETAAQAFVEGEVSNARKLIEQIRSLAAEGENRISPLVETLCEVLVNWTYVAKPIQMASRAKGLDHPASRDLAYEVRSLSVDLYNRHNLSDASAKLTDCLRREFAFLSEFAARVSEDASTLAELQKARDQATANKAEFERSLSHSAEIGAVFKDKVEMSATGLTWKGRTYRLEDINTLRWGGTRHSVNGIPTGTTYEIHLATPAASTVINLRNETIYGALVDRLWRGVGVRLVYGYAECLKRGERLTFPGAFVEDGAVTLTRRKMFKANEDVRLTWDKVRVWSADGCFVIGMDGDTGVRATMPYVKTDNVVVLEYLIRTFFKSGKPTIGAMLE